MAKKIAVIGAGYVGLVLGIGLSDFGHYVTCVDKDDGKIKLLKKGRVPIFEPGLEEYLDKNIKAGRIKFTRNIKESIKENEIIFIAVGTPSQDDGNSDLSQFKEVAKEIVKNLNGYKLIVTKSTVPVGTNRWLFNLIKEKSKNKNFDVISNPEFLREGKGLQDFFHPDRVVMGYERKKAKEIMVDIYRSLYLIETPFVLCNWETAELIKYASNAFLATKITFINQIANLCEAVGADVHVVAKAMGKDGRISPKFLHPGPGFGGSCFPKDIKALVKIGEKFNEHMSLVKEVINANEAQKLKIIEKLERNLGTLRGKKITILGLSFKADTDDIRESTSIVVINKLIQRGAKIKVHDPKALHNAERKWGKTIEYFSNEYEAVRNADAVVILTEWNEYRNMDIEMLKKLMKGNVIIDGRNVLSPSRVKSLGFRYEGMGRK